MMYVIIRHAAIPCTPDWFYAELIDPSQPKRRRIRACCHGSLAFVTATASKYLEQLRSPIPDDTPHYNARPPSDNYSVHPRTTT